MAWGLTSAGNEHDKQNFRSDEGFTLPHQYYYLRRKFIESQASGPSPQTSAAAFDQK
jgi:hypothetical protein